MVDNFKYTPVDSEEKQRIETICEEWHEMERNLTGVTSIKEQSFEKRKSNLQADLKSFYKQQCTSIPLSPSREQDLPLDEIFVKPDIIPVTKCKAQDNEEKTPLKTLRGLFYKGKKLCKNIELKGETGLGKTSFSMRLALAWCHAKKPDKSENNYFSEDEIANMRRFSFLFLVLLRDTISKCDIETLIFDQIFLRLSHEYTIEDLKTIFRQESCLVIIDGLDKWTFELNCCSHEKGTIFQERMGEKLSVLTTTRPSVSHLNSSHIDQTFELKGLSDRSAKKLTRSMISHFYGTQDEKEIDDYENDFNITVKSKDVSDLTTIPLFLVYFFLSWFYKRNEKTQACLVELMLSRTEKTDEIQKVENVKCDIPPYLNDYLLCKQFYTRLKKLGSLAFQTLKTPEFDGCLAEEYLSSNELKFCLKTGLITPRTAQSASVLGQKANVSFAHTKLQEFLAELYIKSIDEEEIKQIYRGSLQAFSDPLKDIQNKLILCKNEGSLVLQDVFIDESCKSEEYRKGLKLHIQRNKHNIRSLTINMSYLKDTSFTESGDIQFFAFCDLTKIEKIIYRGSDYNHVLPLLKNTVKCLSISCVCSWTPSLLDKVANLMELEAIQISWFSFNHRELTSFLAYISQRSRMREIKFEWLVCTNPLPFPTGLTLDLSKHVSLRKLTLDRLPLSQINVNMAQLEECSLQLLNDPNLVLNFQNYAESKICIFECGYLQSSKAIDVVIDKVRSFRHVRKVMLSSIDLGTRTLTVSPYFVNIESLELNQVTMEASNLRKLFHSVLQLRQRVTVAVWLCTISPEEEFEKVKEEIMKLKDWRTRFVFKEITD